MILHDFWDYLLTRLLVFAAVWFFVFVSIFVDLGSGIAKAKRNRERISSRGLRNTTNKIARYFSVLTMTTIADFFQMLFVFSHKEYDTWQSVPILPYFAFCVAGFFIFTEWWSVYENSSDKYQRKKDKKKLGRIKNTIKEIRK